MNVFQVLYGRWRSPDSDDDRPETDEETSDSKVIKFPKSRIVRPPGPEESDDGVDLDWDALYPMPAPQGIWLAVGLGILFLLPVLALYMFNH